MQPLFAYNALIWKNTITILTLILFVVFLVRGLYLCAVLGKHLLKSNQGFQYQEQARDIRNSFLSSSSLASGSSSSRGQTLQERCDRYRDEREDALRKLEDLRRQFKDADNTEDRLRKERDAMQQDVPMLRTKLSDEEERSER